MDKTQRETPEIISGLKLQVDRNCHISDANFWGDYSICELLFRLRQRYMWEKGIKPWEKVDYKALGEFIEAREKLWEKLEGEELGDIEIDGESFSPFDVVEINKIILPQGYCYGAGYAKGMKPSFFLAELSEFREWRGFGVYYTGRELSRDLYTTPAMLLDNLVFLRLESAREFIWEKLEEAEGWKEVYLQDFKKAYGLSGVDREVLWQKLEEIAKEEIEVFLRHEVAEAKIANEELQSRIVQCSTTPLEVLLRALADLLADFTEEGMLDFIIKERRRGSLALYFMNLSGMRRVLLEDFIKSCSCPDIDWYSLESLRVEQEKELRKNLSKLLEILRSGGDYSTLKGRLKRELLEPLGLNL